MKKLNHSLKLLGRVAKRKQYEDVSDCVETLFRELEKEQQVKAETVAALEHAVRVTKDELLIQLTLDVCVRTSMCYESFADFIYDQEMEPGYKTPGLRAGLPGQRFILDQLKEQFPELFQHER